MAKHSRRLADAHDLRRRRKRQAAARRTNLHAAESLESRFALAVSAMANVGLATNQAQGLASDWAVILSSNADDVFMQRIATGEVSPGDPQDPTGYDEQDLIYADNSSFLNAGPGTFGRIADIDLVDTIYVTNGQQVTVNGVRHDQYPLTSTALLAAPWTTTFVLSRATIEDGETCFGTISYGGNIWTFTNGVNPNSAPLDFDYPNAAFTIAGPGYPLPGAAVPPELPIRPIAIGFADAANAAGDAVAIVTWSGYPVVTPLAPDPSLTIRYDADNAPRGPVIDPNPGDPLYVNYNQDFVTDFGRLPSAGAIATFTVPVTNVHPGGIVNGTLSGQIDVTADGVPDFQFAPAQLFGPLQNRLVFTNLTTGAGPALTGTFQTGDVNSNARTLQGDYDPLLGTIRFQFFNGASPQALNGDVTIVRATYATYDQDPLPMTATFFAGLDIHNELYVDLLTSGSTINVESPIIHTQQDTELWAVNAPGADIDLRATNVNVKAVLSAVDSIRIGPSNVAFPQIAQASAYAVIDTVVGSPTFGQVTSIVIPPGSGGLGYNPLAMPVTVWIAPPGGGGTQATATAVVDQNGIITSITLVNPGSGYAAAPQVAISPPPSLPSVPASAVAPAPVAPGVPSPAWGAFAVVGSDPTLPTYGQVIAVLLPPGAGGQGYVVPPTVRVAPPPPGGTPAVVNAVLGAGGAVVGFTVVNPGAGYATAPNAGPQIWIDPPPALAANVAPPSPGIAQGFAVMTPVAPATVPPTYSVRAIAIPPGLGGQGYDPLNPPLVFISAPTGAGAVQATATATVLNGVVTGIVITNPGAGYTGIPAVTIQDPPAMPPIGPGFVDPTTLAYPVPRASGQAPVAEQVTVDSSVAAQFYDIVLGDDPNTAAIPRGRLFVSTSGSLSGALPVTPGAVATAAQRVFVQANNADVLVEGQIYATEQTYLIQSAQAADATPTDGLEPEHTPFVFSTRSPATGSQTGVIRGGTIAVTLGNDTPTPEVGSAALNTVDLQTQADSIRIKAATRAGAPLTGPFPYDLTIREVDDVRFDAVAASSRPINLSAGGDILFNAALATASDLRVTADGTFTVTSPVSTTRGSLDITGTNVTVANSIRVLDPVYDPSRDDITLRATGGDVNLTGLVSAVNNVNILQVNGTGPRQYAASTPGGLVIPDLRTVEQPLVITDDYTFNDVNVLVNLAHTFVGDLTIALVAPDGTVITLFNRSGGGGNNLTNTVFDSEAATPIGAGQAPYTGSYQPAQPLTPLYGRSTLGTWRLRVTDNAAVDTGTLLNFGLTFNIAGQQYGRVAGPARVVAERLNVEAGGSVSVFTNVDRLDGVAATGFTVDEQDDIAITSLRSGGLVSLRAAGVDAGLGNRYTDNARALTAKLVDVTSLEASAPAGSMEIIADTGRTLVLGQAKAIAAGLATPMQAAGDVVIRTTAGDIDVLDGPLAGRPQVAVRVATTANLAATYAQNVPGTRASTLTAAGNGSLNTAGIDGVTNLWAGDRVLVRNQTNAAQNGIYVITSLGSASSRWVLTRAGDADTTAELPANLRVVVSDGLQAGTVYGFSYADALGTVPIATTVVPNRPESLLVRAATTGSLLATYNPATFTVTAAAVGVLPLIDGVALAVGDRVLVRQGTHTAVDPLTSLPVNTTRVSNGVYQVVSLGSGSTTWQLQRVTTLDGSAWTPGTPLDDLLGYVNVREGVLSTPSVGGVYRVAFDSLGISPLTATAQTFATEIGSDRLASVVTFVASSAAGTNTAAGALGKMIALRQANTETRTLDGEAAGVQAMNFKFSNLITTPIQLAQQLPAVSKPFAIDGNSRYTPTGTTGAGSSRIIVDGSRISRDRFDRTLFNGTLSVTRPTASTIRIPLNYSRFGELRTNMMVTGSQIRQGARIVAIDPVTRTLTLTPNSVVGSGGTLAPTSVTISTEVNGLDFVAGSGSPAVDTDGDPATPLVLQPGAVLANVTVGGFEGGAAVTIQGVDGVMVRNSVIGQQPGGTRLSSRSGVLVSGGVTSATLLNNTIVGHAGAGVSIQGAASGVVMVGNIIGSALLPNQNGVEVLSTGANRIGADPILPGRALGAIAATRNLAANTLTLPASYTTWGDLFVNLGVKGPGIAAGARIAAINQATRVVTLTAGGVTTAGTGTVTFGNFVETIEFGTTLVLPLGINMADLYLGQIVTGAGIRSATTITAIDVPGRTITLSSPLTATATGVNAVSVTFSSPGRNQIAFNRYGVWLALGANTVTNSDIYNNVFDGVRIVGGSQTVGTSTTASAKSNAIYSNGGYGVNIVAPAVVGSQVIRGNYLGTRAPGNVRLANALGNVNPRLPQWTPNATTNVDPQGNVHGPARTSGGGTTQPPPSGGIHPLR